MPVLEGEFGEVGRQSPEHLGSPRTGRSLGHGDQSQFLGRGNKEAIPSRLEGPVVRGTESGCTVQGCALLLNWMRW